MAKGNVAEALAAHSVGLKGDVGVGQAEQLDDGQREELAALALLAQRLREALQPVEPPAGFVRSLQRELARASPRQATTDRNPRRTALVAAAAVGSLISVASVVGAVVYFATRRRMRTHARPARASM